MEGHMMQTTSICGHTAQVERIAGHGYLKGKSVMMIFDQYSNLKYKYGNRHLWAAGY